MAESSGLHWPAEAPVHGGTQVDRILSNATDKTLLTTWVNEQGNSALHFERGPTPPQQAAKRITGKLLSTPVCACVRFRSL
jgi:hypothetical protein